MCHMPEINKWENDKSQIDSSRKSLQQPSKVCYTYFRSKHFLSL